MNLPTKIPPRPVRLSVDESRWLSGKLCAVEEIGFQKWRFKEQGTEPLPEERQFLAARKQALDAWLEPASQRVIDAEITSIFALMAVKDISEEDRLREMRLWRNDLLRAQLSTYGLTEACARFRLGESGDSKGKFAPKIGEVVQEARAIEKAFWKERSDIRTVLLAEPAKPPADPEKMKAALDEWEKVVKPLLQSCDISNGFPPKRRPLPDVRYGECVEEPTAFAGPVPVSDRLKAQLAAKPSPSYVEGE
jgi:hypothetical protein